MTAKMATAGRVKPPRLHPSLKAMSKVLSSSPHGGWQITKRLNRAPREYADTLEAVPRNPKQLRPPSIIVQCQVFNMQRTPDILWPEGYQPSPAVKSAMLEALKSWDPEDVQSLLRLLDASIEKPPQAKAAPTELARSTSMTIDIDCDEELVDSTQVDDSQATVPGVPVTETPEADVRQRDAMPSSSSNASVAISDSRPSAHEAINSVSAEGILEKAVKMRDERERGQKSALQTSTAFSSGVAAAASRHGVESRPSALLKRTRVFKEPDESEDEQREKAARAGERALSTENL